MADRRMFSKRIINSGRFLKMPISSQALYFHLGLNADDDGIVEAYNVISSINGCTEDDLRVLVSKGFIQVLNEDLVTYITDWTENNKIRADRKIDSIYKDLLISVNPSVRLIEKRPRADIKPKIVEMDNQWTSNGQPMDGIGKDRLGKDSIGNNVSKETLSSILDYLNKKAGTHYQTKSKNTQKHIKARLSEGYTLDDFKKVVDNKVADWGEDATMSKYLRPDTLFGTKFESYLNQKVVKSNKPSIEINPKQREGMVDVVEW